MSKKVIPDALGKNDKLTYESEVSDLEAFDRGSSCIAYTGVITSVDANSETGTHCVVKEFCPESIKTINKQTFTIKRDNKTVVCDNPELWERKKKQFDRDLKTYLEYCKLYGDFDWPMIPVRDFILDNNTYYVISEETRGMLLSKYLEDEENKTLPKLLKVMEALLIALARLEKEKIVMVDCKPDNMIIEFAADKSCQIRFFDIDGFLNLKNNLSRLADDKLPKTEMYAPINYHMQERYYVSSYWHIACAGLILFYNTIRLPFQNKCEASSEKESLKKYFECIAGIVADDGELETRIVKRFPSVSEEVLDQLVDFYKYLFTDTPSAECAKKAVKKVQGILATYNKEHPVVTGTRESAMKEEINDGIRFIDMEKAFLLLDKYPVFNYMKNKDLEVMIVGDHHLSRAFFKVVFSCAQVMDSRKRNIVPKIKLLLKKPAEFLNMLRGLPELPKCVSVCLNGLEETLGFNLDEELSKETLADINIFNSEDFCLEEEQGDTRYILLLSEKTDENKTQLQEIVARAKRPTFVAYLTDEDDQATPRREGVCDIVPIYDTFVLPAADMAEHNALLHRAYLLDRYYSRNLYSNTKDTELWKSFEEPFKDILDKDPKKINLYNIFSSIRSAVTLKYKIFSLHGNTGQHDVMHVTPLDLKKMLNQKGNLNYLMALEHRSWSAWLIVNGWQRIETYLTKEYGEASEEDIKSWIQETYARFGKYHNKKNIHTALVACGSTRYGFKGQPKDPLDESTKRNREAIKELADKTVDIDAWSRDIVGEARKLPAFEDPARNIPAILDSMNSLLKAIKDGDRSAENMWNDSMSLLKQRLQESLNDKKKNYRIEKFIEKLDAFTRKLKPLFEYNIEHDFKQSDIAILEAMPIALYNLMDICVHRPLTASMRDNVFGILLLEPDSVVFVNHLGVEQEEFKKQCDAIKKVLASFGRDNIDYLEEGDESKFSDQTFHILDMTRVDHGEDVYATFIETCTSKTFIDTKTGRCEPYLAGKNKGAELEIFPYDMKMMVSDASKLAGLEMEVLKGGLEEERYKQSVYALLMHEIKFNDLKMNVSFKQDGKDYPMDFVATKRNLVTNVDQVYLLKAFDKIIPDGDDIRDLIKVGEIFGGNCILMIVTSTNRIKSARKDIDLSQYIKQKNLDIKILSFTPERDIQLSVDRKDEPR